MGSIKGQKHNPKLQGKYAHMNPNDVVFTPDWLAKQIVRMYDLDMKGSSVLEPCKGEGAFTQFLPDAQWCELAEGKNFYDYTEKVEWIVTNPPYSDYNRFLDHAFELAQNIVLLVPMSKMFKSMGTIKKIYNWGGIVEIKILPASKAGFPFGFPCAIYHLQKFYGGKTDIEILDLDIDNQTELDLITASSGKGAVGKIKTDEHDELSTK